MRHIALLGDSIFDNASYTGGEPDVVTHLRSMLPSGWRASLLAVDGAVSAGLHNQLDRLPPDATDIVISSGGNDALGSTDLLATRVSSTSEALELFAQPLIFAAQGRDGAVRLGQHPGAGDALAAANPGRQHC